jgi:hypothetical protein
MIGFVALRFISEGRKARHETAYPGAHVFLDEKGNFAIQLPGFASPGRYEWTKEMLESDGWQPYDPKPAEDRRCGTCGDWNQFTEHCDNKMSARFSYMTHPGNLCDQWRPIPASPPDDSRFFIVWSPKGKTPPQKQYTTHAHACADAEALAKKHPGQRFFVLDCKKYCVAEDVKVAPDWEKAWDEIDKHFKSGVLVISAASVKAHDPRNKTELKATWKKTKERH